jgi:pimeloyl-ACP methyl ester carboxylesterase
MWAEHGSAFAEAGYRVIAMDLPGFGEATPSGELAPWSDVLETLDGLGVDNFALIGNSFGAAVALRIAVCAPGRVAALVLVSAPPVALEPSRRLQAAWEAEESALADGDIDGAVLAVLDAWTLPGADAGVRNRVAEMQRRAFELQAAAGDLPEAEDPVTADPDALSRLEIPALVAAGEFDMPDFQLGAESLARSLGNAQQVVIAGAGHLASMEQPDSFRRLVLGFLQSAARF